MLQGSTHQHTWLSGKRFWEPSPLFCSLKDLSVLNVLLRSCPWALSPFTGEQQSRSLPVLRALSALQKYLQHLFGSSQSSCSDLSLTPTPGSERCTQFVLEL